MYYINFIFSFCIAMGLLRNIQKPWKKSLTNYGNRIHVMRQKDLTLFVKLAQTPSLLEPEIRFQHYLS